MEKPKNNFRIVSDKKARMILPNAITLIGVCIGLSSIKFALDGKFALAVVAILFASLMDALDVCLFNICSLCCIKACKI